MPTPTSIDGLIEKASSYLNEEQVERIRQAFEFGALAHQGQKRKAGGDYIWHPVAVAEILAEYKLDHESIIAAILHDVVEDTPFDKNDIIERFGESVADMVEGVTKLAKVKYKSAQEAHAESFQKMMLAMSRDIRVILIKLADRLHNMRTMGAMRRDKQYRIADETLEIYAPIAARLGIHAIRIELEDLCFKAKHPYRYEVLKHRLQQVRGGRNEALKHIADNFQHRLNQDGIPATVIGREKHLYSLYSKMRNHKFSEILDIFAFRVIVDTIDNCYRALGSVHSLYKPLPLRFKDYIAVPKKNGYQSLHTTVMGPYNNAHLEVQIRTEQMHEVSEHGIAAHWQYKQKGDDENEISQVDTLAQEWVKNLLEIQQSTGNSLDFLENVKIDLFPEVIYVFTPKGDIIDLPRGATALDFAYALHTDLGHATKGCRVDKKACPLRTVLESGQSIEIIKGKEPAPQASWLQFVTTAKARTQIRHYMRHLKASDAIDLGERLLNTALLANHLSLGSLSDETKQTLLEELHVESWQDLLGEIGSGNRMPALVAKQIQEFAGEPLTEEQKQAANTTLPITGTEGMVIHYAHCCHPIPGDSILGFISKEKGLVIHRECCTNVKHLKSQVDKCIELRWADNVEGTFLAELQLEVDNVRGSLGTIASTIASTNTDIDRVHSDDKDESYSLMNFVIKVRDRIHLAQVMRVLKRLPIVQKIQRN